MAVTYSATPMGAYRSAVRNVLISVAATQSEVLTLVHRLGACPHEIRMMLRSVISFASGIPLTGPIINALNASQAILCFGADAQTQNQFVQADIIAEFTHSVVQ